MNNNIKSNKGFTLVELLVVISIIGFIASISVVAFDSARKKARDAQRVASFTQIINALNLYYDKYQTWPANAADDGCSTGWDDGYCQGDDSDGFIQPLVTEGIFAKTPGDPSLHDTQAFKYYLYDAGSYNCDARKGKFYVLGITDLETDVRPAEKFSGSGFSCPERNWQDEFDYVTGKFEIN